MNAALEKLRRDPASGVFIAGENAEWRVARPRHPLSTRLPGLDNLLGGGLPRGRLIEIAGPSSSGKTSLLFNLLAETTARGELAAYIDAFDAFDPRGAEDAGMDLRHLLWVRLRGLTPAEAVARAMKAADIAARSGGFGLIVLDLASADIESGKYPIPPSKSWFRLQRAIADSSAALVVLQRQAVSGSASSVALHCRRLRADWQSAARRNAPALLRGIVGEVESFRGKRHGCVALHSAL